MGPVMVIIEIVKWRHGDSDHEYRDDELETVGPAHVTCNMGTVEEAPQMRSV